jgi:hypothetical protein
LTDSNDEAHKTQIILKRTVERQLEKRLNGDPSKIDPDVSMEFQTEFLPYDKKWEFPRKRLRLGLLFITIELI